MRTTRSTVAGRRIGHVNEIVNEIASETPMIAKRALRDATEAVRRTTAEDGEMVMMIAIGNDARDVEKASADIETGARAKLDRGGRKTTNFKIRIANDNTGVMTVHTGRKIHTGIDQIVTDNNLGDGGNGSLFAT